MKKGYIILTVIVLGICWMIADAFLQPGVSDLKGNFKETAFYRNENNTGPVVRMYAATVTDTLWQQMIAYGNLMPHTKYGNTKVFFFYAAGEAPDKLYAGDKNFDARYAKYCMGEYEKNGMGKVSLKKYGSRASHDREPHHGSRASLWRF